MALPATDNFNRTNGALGTNWTGSVGSDLAIFNNTVRGSSGADSSMYWSADAPDAAQYCQVTLSVANASGYGGPCVRASSTDWVFLDAANGEATDHYKLEWYNSGSWTAIGSQYNVTPTASDVLKITASGTTFTGYINGTQRCQGSNGTAPSTGYGGIYVYAELHQVDDFEVGNLSTVLSVSKSETIGTAESKTVTVGTSQVSKSETVGTSETSTARIVTQVNVSDTVGAITDTPAIVVGTSAVSKSETISTTDTPAVALETGATLEVNVSDTAGTTEAKDVAVSAPQVSKSETIGTTDTLAVTLPTWPETFEASEGSWAVTIVESGTGDVTRSSTQADSGTYSARCFTTASGDTAYVRDPSWSDDFDSIGANNNYIWQRARVYIPSATISALSGSEYFDLGGFFQSDGNGGFYLRIMASGAIYVYGRNYTTGSWGSCNIHGTIPTDEWFDLEIGLRSQNAVGIQRGFIILVNGDAYGWFLRGSADQGDKNYNRAAMGIVGTNSADDLNVYIDNWQQYTTGTTPSGTDNRPTSDLATLDYTDVDGRNMELHWGTWADGDVTLNATYGMYSTTGASGHIQSGIAQDRMPDLSDGWTEIKIEWPGGTTPPYPPTGYDYSGDILFAPMVAFHKSIESEINLEVQARYHTGSDPYLEYRAWTGSIVSYGTWTLPLDATSGQHIPGRGDILRVRWEEATATTLHVTVDYYDASASTWNLAVIDDTRDLSDVGAGHINYLDSSHRAVSNTIDSDDYSIVYQTAGTYATFTLAISKSETIGTSEAVTLTVQAPNVSVSDTIGTSETTTVKIVTNIAVSDTTSVTDTPTIFVPIYYLSVSDTIGTAEQVAVYMEGEPEALGIAITPDSVFAVGVRIY